MNLDCDMIRDLLALYHDGLASRPSKEAVAAHLKNCASCRTYYRQYCSMYRQGRAAVQTGEGSYPHPDYSYLAKRMRYIRGLLGLGAIVYTGISAYILIMLLMRLKKE